MKLNSLTILDLTTDSVFSHLPPEVAQVVHCQTGKALMHSGCPKIPPPSAKFRLLRELTRARRYDWIIVPPVHIDWNIGNGFLRRRAKDLLRLGLHFPRVTKLLKRMIFGCKAKFAVVDYSDEIQLSRFALGCIQPHHYFMLNVPRSLVGKRQGAADSLIHYLPTIIEDNLIDRLSRRSGSEPQYEVFVAGDYHNPQRIKQREAAELLSQRGLRVYDLTEKSFEKFTHGLLLSSFCMAGRGLAYHCFRPLEAIAAGAVPICHSSEHDVYHEWQNGVNCLLYPHALSPGQIADFIQEAMHRCADIPGMLKEARALLETRHRASSLALHLFEVLNSSNTLSVPSR